MGWVLCLALYLADPHPDPALHPDGLSGSCWGVAGSVTVTKLGFFVWVLWDAAPSRLHLLLLAHLSLMPGVSALFLLSHLAMDLTLLCTPSTAEFSLGTAWGRALSCFQMQIPVFFPPGSRMLLTVLVSFKCSCPSAAQNRPMEKSLSSSDQNNTLLSGFGVQEVLRANLLADDNRYEGAFLNPWNSAICF